MLARLGDADGARNAATRSLSLAGGPAFDPAEPTNALGRSGEYALWGMGELELSLGWPEAADRFLGPLGQALLDAGVREPGELRFLVAEVEALTMLDRLEPAGRLAAVLESEADRVRRPSVWAAALSARAIVQAARLGRGQWWWPCSKSPSTTRPRRRSRSSARGCTSPWAGCSGARRPSGQRAKRSSARSTFSTASVHECGPPLRPRSSAGSAAVPRPARAHILRGPGRPAGRAGLVEQGGGGRAIRDSQGGRGEPSRIYAKRGVRSRTELASLLASEGKH